MVLGLLIGFVGGILTTIFCIGMAKASKPFDFEKKN